MPLEQIRQNVKALLLGLSAASLLCLGCGGETTEAAASGASTASGSGGASVSSSATAGGASSTSGSTGGSTGAGGSSGPGTVGNVSNTKTFEVQVTKDVVFGQGLTRSSWDASDGMPMDLLLDVYEPVRDKADPMPVVVVIHGGGFVGGTKSHAALSDMAQRFAERGWVSFSIDYRLAKHFGNLPGNYPVPPQGATQKQINQYRALYPACRDAKAAIRWIRAHAKDYNVSSDHIAAIGGSAGSFISMALGTSDEADCVAEITEQEDSTLAATNLSESSRVQTIVDHWGGVSILNMLESMGGNPRFDATDAPVSIVHGTEDPTVLFSQAETIRDAYIQTGVPYAFYPLEGKGHGPWGAKVADKSLTKLAFDFIVEQQKLLVE